MNTSKVVTRIAPAVPGVMPYGSLGSHVMPRPEALPFVDDAKTLTLIQGKARQRFRGEERLIGDEVGEKVRRLIDEHIISLGINPKIPPIEITADEFEEHVGRQSGPRAQASEMEHALPVGRANPGPQGPCPRGESVSPWQAVSVPDSRDSAT